MQGRWGGAVLSVIPLLADGLPVTAMQRRTQVATARDKKIRRLQKLISETQMIADHHNLDLDIDGGQLIFYDQPERGSNFRAKVKERQRGQPCFIVLETDQCIGISPDKNVVFEMLEGTFHDEALNAAARLNEIKARVVVRS